MNVVVEEQSRENKVIYKVTKYDNNGKEIYIRIVYFIINKHREYDHLYYFMHNQDGELCKEVFNYINYYHFNKSDNSKIQKIKSIKRLYEYSLIMEKPIDKMSAKDFNNFQYFLTGTQIPVSKYKFYTTRNASIDLVRSIITECKNFLLYCGYKNSNLLTTQTIGRKQQKRNCLCPKFISIKEFNDIINYVENDKESDELERLKICCIYKLMFNAGLRIGEVLGLTVEDFEEVINNDGELLYKVIIRNRLSDNIHQKAKRCKVIHDERIYHSKDYKTLNNGYQIAYISNELYDDIMEYFDKNFDRFMKQYKKYPDADSVELKGENYYIFTNKTKPTTLNIDILYKYTRKLFLDLNLKIGEITNNDNLLHRFRHGFVMKLLYHFNISPFEAIHLTRHASVRSLEPYNNPTDEQLASLLSKVEENINV